MNTAYNHSAPKGQCICQRAEVLNALDGLLQDDPEAFFSLLGGCTSVLPMEIGERPKNKLIKLRLLREDGTPPRIVRETVMLIVSGTHRSAM